MNYSTSDTNIISIAVTIDKGYYQHAGVMLCSVFENNPACRFCIYLFTELPVVSACKKLHKLCTRYGHSLEVITIPVQLVSQLVTSAHATSAVYYRLLIPALLKHKTDTFLYLDSDLLVLDDLQAIWKTDLQTYALAAVEDPFYHTQNYLNLPVEASYFNSGVMLVHIPTWEKNHLTDQAIAFIENNPEKIQYWDQDALNAVLSGAWKKLPAQWNVTAAVYEKHADNQTFPPAIIHFTGSHKPWHSHCKHPAKEKYFYYLRKTPWKRFRLPEQTIWHHLKQSVKVFTYRIK